MRILLFFISLTITASSIYAQDRQEAITATLMNYINGTSYNNLEQISSAFYPEAELFLDGKDNNLRVLPINEYMGFFEKRTPGEFNGRVGRILSIEQFGNIAMAKAEILIPHSELRYIDMFILKQIDGEWKIISKTANSKTSNRTGEQVLFVLSSADHYGDSDIPTGASFSEIVIVYEILESAGYTVHFVSPEGGAVPLSHIDMSDDLQKEYIYDHDLMFALKNSLSPDQVVAEDYKAIYYVGGGNTMYGVPENEAIQSIAMTIYEDNGGVVSSVCHGTAGIVNLKKKDGSYLVNGEKVSGYPEQYENQEREYFKQFPFLIQKTIEEHGGTFEVGERLDPYIVGDGRLITGQSNRSCEAVANRIIERLAEIKENENEK